MLLLFLVLVIAVAVGEISRPVWRKFVREAYADFAARAISFAILFWYISGVEYHATASPWQRLPFALLCGLAGGALGATLTRALHGGRGGARGVEWSR